MKRAAEQSRRQREAGERLLLGGYEAVQRKLGDRSPFTREILGWIVDLYEAWGKPEKVGEYRELIGAVSLTHRR
ncbi:MAG: hypothetical protein V3T72_10515 [Thermoanaerobaculia bacterium]